MTDTTHFLAILDALQWLQFHQNKGYVHLLGKDYKKIFALDRRFTVHTFAFVMDENGLSLAMREDETTQWFANLPWSKVQVYDHVPTFLNLICKPTIFPASPDINFEGGELPPFSLKIPMTGKLVNTFDQMDEINVGLFRPASQNRIELIKTPLVLNVPVEVRRTKSSRREKTSAK